MLFRVLLACLFLTTFLTGQNESPRWIAHYTAANGGFETLVNLINTDFEGAASATLTPFAQDGTQLDGFTRTIEVPPGHRLALSRDDLDWTNQPVSHLLISAPNHIRAGATYRANREGSMTADVTAKTETASVARFVPVSGEQWFDGLVAVNPNDTAAEIILTAHDTMGNSLYTTKVNVNAGGKWLNTTAAIFEEINNTTISYIEMHADQSLLFLALRGSLGALDPPVLTEVQPDLFANTPAKLSYGNQISRLVNRKCAGCHVEGGIGPFVLTSYEALYSTRDWVAENVADGNMPPWRADDSCTKFVGSQALNDTEKAMLLDWIASGAEAGDDARVPEPIQPPSSEWGLGEPDLVLQYTEPFEFTPGPDVYRCFPMSVGNTAEMQIAGLEVQVGNPEIVHHVLVFISDTGNGPTIDAREEGPGYVCFGGPKTGDFRLIGGWAPGSEPQLFAENVGMTIAPDADIIVQVHYHYSTVGGMDQTKVGLHFADQERPDELFLLPLVNQQFVLPAGEKNIPVEQSFTLPIYVEAKLYSVMPHMHLLGKTISVELEYPSGSQECVVDIPKWDFNWQRFYQYEQPLTIPGGTTVSLHCTYDNSAENPNNPFDPPMDVTWGEATTDEMALAFLGITSPILRKTKTVEAEWEWPFQIKSYITEPKPLPEGVRLRKRLPSCCSPEGESKPWGSCPSSLLEGNTVPEQP